MKKILLLLFTLYLLPASAQQESIWMPGIVLVKVSENSEITLPQFTDSSEYPYFDSLVINYGFYAVKPRFTNPIYSRQAHCYEIRFSSTNIDSLVKRLEAYSFIEYAAPIGKIQYFNAPNDDKYPLQWGMCKILADSVWQLLPGQGKEIKIGIIDDAFLLGHEDLQENIFVNLTELNGTPDFDDDFNTKNDDFYGWDFGEDDNDVNPPSNGNNKDYSHGTHCGMIAAAGLSVIAFWPPWCQKGCHSYPCRGCCSAYAAWVYPFGHLHSRFVFVLV